jgi:hypothetical protein
VTGCQILTIQVERFIFKTVKKKIWVFVLLFFLIAFFYKSLSLKGLSFSKNSAPALQTTPAKKPNYDYMSTFLSRNTNPLGLKEDLTLKKLLKQSSAKWAARAGKRHILD